MKTFLVTGATGFLGSHLVRALLEQNHMVVGISRSGRDRKRKNGIWKNAKFHKADLAKKMPHIEGAGRIDGIFHLASQLGHSKNVGYAEYYAGNVATIRNVIEFAKKNNIKFIVHVSSCSVFGRKPEEPKLNEAVIPFPKDYYGLTKFIAERMLEIEISRSPVKVVLVRFTSIFGENDTYGIVNTLWRLAAAGMDMELLSNGERYRNLIHVSDAVRALLEVPNRLDGLESYEEIIVGNRESIQVFELAKKIKSLLKSRSKIVRVKKYPKYDWDVFLDTRKAEKILDFRPMPVFEGLKKYAAAHAHGSPAERR